jgi:serine/threonine-protein kinase HipA
MMENKCLYCYKEFNSEELKTDSVIEGFHQRCSKRFFGTSTPPKLEFTQDEILRLAESVIKSQKSVTGAQPKLSLGWSEDSTQPERLTIVGLWGEYILKPQTEIYPTLPENEDLSMHLARISKIKTVSHSLIKLKSGELAYITKRVDRENGSKNHMEDFCQLTERLTEHKYKGSYEQIAKSLIKYSVNPGLDITNFYEIVLFSFLTGNNDMHLKNFSLLKLQDKYNLCPAYDLLSAQLVVEDDKEDLALNLNGKKKKITHKDFEKAMKNSGLGAKVIHNIFKKFKKQIPHWINFIDRSFLPESTKKRYKELVIGKSKQLELPSTY